MALSWSIQLLLAAVLINSIMSIRVAQAQDKLLYVNTTACDSQGTSMTMCHTFKWYSKHSEVWCNYSNTEMVFEEGIHFLDTLVSLTNCSNFTMVGNGPVPTNSDGLPKPSSRIKCNTGSLNTGLVFTNSTRIQIVGLEFDSCGGSPSLELKKKEKCSQQTSSIHLTSVQDLWIRSVVIRNALGYGIITNDIYGTDNVVINSVFQHPKTHSSSKQSGNAIFNFTNLQEVSRLNVTSSWFLYGRNSQCSKLSGGVNIHINSTFSVHVVLHDITAIGNSGTYGNLALYFVDTQNGSSISIEHSKILDGISNKGAGLKLWAHHSNTVYYSNTSKIIRYIVLIKHCVFRNNSVKVTGGAMYIAFFNHANSYDGVLRKIQITNCNFTKNTGDGAAMELIQHLPTGHRPIAIFETSINHCNFINNSKPSVDGPILDFISVDVSVSNSVFNGSNSSVMALRNTYLHLNRSVLFANNTAQIGGALKVCDSSVIFIHNGTNITFINNRAQKGGAIYIQQACMDTTPTCAFQLSFPPRTLIEEISKHVRFTFINNSARIAGDAIYGGSLDNCTTFASFSNSTSRKVNYKRFIEIINNRNAFDISPQGGPSLITSDPRTARFCKASRYHGYITTQAPMSVYPGEDFTVPLVTVGQMNNFTLGSVNATLVDDDWTFHTLFKSNHPTASANCTNHTFEVRSNRTHATIKFSAVTFDIATRYKIIPVELHIHLLPCPLGFELSQSPPYTCVCSPQLTKHLLDINTFASRPVSCDITRKVITVPHQRLWFGCYAENQNDSSNCSSLISTPNCDRYCNNSADTINVSISDLDSQCLPNHTGVMCGACKPGYSRMLGSIYECHKDCTNRNLTFILPLFFASGFCLIVFIMALNLTVTQGTLNGLLVYAMVIQTYIKPSKDTHNIMKQFTWVFVSWINLTFGIKTCFYEGMDGYMQVWHLYIQTLYLFLLQALIVLLTRRFTFFTRLFGRNIVNVLATLFFLQYSNIVFANLATLVFARMYYSESTNGSRHTLTKYVWQYDGNLPFLGRKHAPLFVVAVIWTLVASFFVISLLLIQCLQKRSGLWCFRWVNTLRPFYDAYTGPCRDSYRFWPGFLLVMRTGLYIMNATGPFYSDLVYQIKVLLTAAICILVMSLGCIFPHGVYKKWPLNVLEFSFFLNLCITSVILGIRERTHNKYSRIIVDISVSIAALTFLGILLYHFHSQMKSSKVARKAAKWLSDRSKKIRSRVTTRQVLPEHNNDSETDAKPDEKDRLLPQSLPPVVSFKDCREPLMED